MRAGARRSTGQGLEDGHESDAHQRDGQLHVPLALVITTGAVWLTAWAFRSAGPV